MRLTTRQREPIQALYDQGLYLQAWQRAQALGPLETWEGAEALDLAGRLAANLGGGALSQRLHTRAHRQDRTNPSARCNYGRHLFQRFGPVVAWRWMRRTQDPFTCPETEVEWIALAAVVAASLRDFETAERLCARAEPHATEPWYRVERARILECEDRYEEALAEARRALEPNPLSRYGVQSVAHLLILLSRPQEAEALLHQASTRLESYAVDYQLALLYYEDRRWPELSAALDRMEHHGPLLAARTRNWLEGIRSECAYAQGDLETALRHAEAAGHGFYARIAQNLRAAQAAPDQRVLLSVGFVRQHHMTCVPATLSALSTYFEKPAEHLEIAEEICYDGTPAHGERLWAKRNGYLSYDFTLTAEVARALLDRGLPFTLTTVSTGSAHLQAVVGYDQRRRTLFLRDPYYPQLMEALTDELIEQQAPTGPRAHLLLPVDRAPLLEGIVLPEAALWDTYHAIQVALVEHRRADAQQAIAALKETHPEHRLTLLAWRSLAHYDGSTTELLAATEALLERYPQEPNWQLDRLAYLRTLSRQEERLARLDTLCETTEGAALPFWEMKARELAADFRRLPETEALLRRVLARQPTNSGALLQLAGLCWSQRRWDDALEFYRFTACLDDKNEHAAHAYFQALHGRGRAETALAYLRRRVTRLGARSSHPARTLYEALWNLDRHDEARAVLEQALAARPGDSELMLFAVTTLARHGRFAEAHQRLEQARGSSSERGWLSAAANLAAAEGDAETELALATTMVEQDPLAVSALRHIARVRARTEGPAAAIATLEAVVERFPYHLGVNQLLEGWYKENQQPEQALAVLDRLQSAHPGDLWTQRERALVRAWSLRQPAEGLVEIEEALRIHPNDPAAHGLRGAILQLLERLPEARQAWMTALTLDADNADALRRLVSTGEDRAARRAALKRISSCVIRQPVRGESIPELARAAAGTLLPEETLTVLQQLHEARPDLWQTWDERADQLRTLARYPEAERLLEGALERFPLLPKLHITHAEVLQDQGRTPEAVAALHRAREIRPDSLLATRRLSEILVETGQAEAAVAVLEKALRRNPQEDYLLQSLAYTLWTLRRYDEALAHLRTALTFDTRSEWAWDRLRDWSLQRGKAAAAVEMVRTLVQARPQDAVLWFRLAQLLPGDALPERLAALENALALAPRFLDAHEEKVRLLAQAGRHAEARAACTPGAFAIVPPQLQARAAWVTVQEGERPRALREIQALLEQEPEYAGGWELLAEWAGEEGDFVLAERAAQRLTRLVPDNAYHWGYLGYTKTQTQDKKGAKEAFRRAHLLSPSYTYAGTALLAAHADDGEGDAVESVLAALLTAQPTDLWIRAYGVRALAKGGRYPAAQRELLALCALPLSSGQDLLGPLRYCERELKALGREGDFERCLAEALRNPSPQGEVLNLRIRLLCERDGWDEARALALRWKDDPARGPQALAAYAVALAEKRKPGTIDFIRDHAVALASEDRAWGNIAHAYELIEELDRGIAWTDDWQQRTYPEPWMLLNRVDALRARGRDAEAAVVSRFALGLPQDYTRGWHALWLAFDSALQGQETTAFLAEHELTERPGFYLFLTALVRTMEKARTGGQPTILRKDLVTSIGQRPLRPFERRLLRRVGRAMSRTTPHLAVRLWSLWLGLTGAP